MNSTASDVLILDVVVEDEVQLFVCEAVVLCHYTVNFVYDGFGKAGIEFIVYYLPCIPVFTRLSFLIFMNIFHKFTRKVVQEDSNRPSGPSAFSG